ncbi:hypothetical protein, partial [Xenorhabdus eapokensis]|uniref:hypothetical protein n=1 Tax=Xenorhabdus eapokensis TaxID=1873482 RepID=UPI000AAAFF93
LKSVGNRTSLPGCEAAYLTLFASGVKRLFSPFFRCRCGVSQHIVGQWWRIIGSFTDVTIVFFENNYRLINYTAKCHFIPTYKQIYPQRDILIKFIEHRANVFVTICAGKITKCFFQIVLKCYCRNHFFYQSVDFSQ